MIEERHPGTLKALKEQGRFSDAFPGRARTLVHRCDSHNANLNPEKGAVESD